MPDIPFPINKQRQEENGQPDSLSGSLWIPVTDLAALCNTTITLIALGLASYQ